MQPVDLFRSHQTPRAVIESALEGVLGEISVTDGPGPPAARLRLGCYAVFGGAAESAGDFVASIVAPMEIIVPDDQRWRDLLFETLGEHLEDRPMRTYSGHRLDAAHLERLASRVPSGYRLEALDLDSAGQLDTDLAPHALQAFSDARAFLESGFGFGALHGERLVAASTSYAISSDRVEVSISTREAHRGRGLATAVAARMFLSCLQLGKQPEWSASNPISKHLAIKLGLRPAGLCDVLFLGG